MSGGLISGGAYPVAYIRGPYTGLMSERLKSGVAGGLYPGAYIRGSWRLISGGIYPGSYIRGDISGVLYSVTYIRMAYI